MKTLLVSLFLALSMQSYADCCITGNTNPAPGSTETYTAQWTYLHPYAIVNWYVSNGTIISSSRTEIVIQWDDTPTWMNSWGWVEVYEDLGGQSLGLGVSLLRYMEGNVETCDGILGPPAIAIDFGTGPNPGPALPGGATTYSYQTNCNITSGEYARFNSSVGCNGSWLGIATDHTPNDVNGYMLIIDGDDRRGEVYRASVSGLTTTFRYEFSAWFVNLSNDDQWQEPRVHFEIRDNSNNLIHKSGSYTITYDPSNPWQRVSFMFDLPVGMTAVQIVLVNEHANSSGNDFLVDDISFAPCFPPLIASFTPNPTITGSTQICNNGTVNLYSWWPTTTIPYTTPGYYWERSIDGVNWTYLGSGINFTRTENTAGIYKYRITAYNTANPNQFLISNVITYYVMQMTVSPNTFHVSGCVSSPVQLNPVYNLLYTNPEGPAFTYNFNWSPGTNLSSTTIANPVVTLPTLPPLNPPNPPTPPPPVNYPYTLTVSTPTFAGCTASNTQTVAHTNPRKVYIFNAFTPNNDGLNDFFHPVNIQDYHYYGAEFSVYNRWGQRIHYRTQGLTLANWSWDGRFNGVPQPSDNYVFMVKIPGCPTNFGSPLPYGVSYNSSTGIISGNCILIR
jgi:gliding motility-associated-like protein